MVVHLHMAISMQTLFAEIPFSDVNLKTHKAEPPHWTSYSSLAEVTSLSLEMSYIARATGQPTHPHRCATDILHAITSVCLPYTNLLCLKYDAGSHIF